MGVLAALVVSRALKLGHSLFDRAQALSEPVRRNPERAIMGFESSFPIANGGFESYSNLMGISFGHHIGGRNG